MHNILFVLISSIYCVQNIHPGIVFQNIRLVIEKHFGNDMTPSLITRWGKGNNILSYRIHPRRSQRDKMPSKTHFFHERTYFIHVLCLEYPVVIEQQFENDLTPLWSQNGKTIWIYYRVVFIPGGRNGTKWKQKSLFVSCKTFGSCLFLPCTVSRKCIPG